MRCSGCSWICESLDALLPPRTHHYAYTLRPEEPDYPIVYKIDDGMLVVLVLVAGRRRDVYRRR